MKTKAALLLILISFPLLFSGCFSEWEDTGEITLNFGNNSRAVARSIDNLEYTVSTDEEQKEIKCETTFSDESEFGDFCASGVNQSITVVVSPGEWKITVVAYNASTDGKPTLAQGSATARVKPGKTTSVTVKMSKLD